MNFWTKESKSLAYQEGYLDKLLEIYPIRSNPKRLMPKSFWKRVIELFEMKNAKELIKLFNQGIKKYDLKFPVECYYASSLRNEPFWIDMNPNTVKELGNLILNLDIDVIYDRCTAPKKVSRQAGPMFTNWLKKKFGDDREIIILGASDSERKNLAKTLVGYHSDKGLDLLIQINDIIIIGEAKFITDSGGTQANQFKSALGITGTFTKNTNVIPLSVVDGHCWRKSTDQFYTAIKNSRDDHIIISALLLEDLFEKIKQLNLTNTQVLNNDILELIQ
ncbi:hypothetical protein ES705_19035 [subsurface metagenome]